MKTKFCNLVQGEGKLNDNFSTGSLYNWEIATNGAKGELIDGKFVVTPVLTGDNIYRGDIRKTGGVTLHAGNYPIVAVRTNRPLLCNYVFDTNLGAYNNDYGKNTGTKIEMPSAGDVFYWDLTKGMFGDVQLPSDTTTELSVFQFKVADIKFQNGEEHQYNFYWIKTFESVDALKAEIGAYPENPFVFKGKFEHPGLLHNKADLARIKGWSTRDNSRPNESYLLLKSSPLSSSSYQMKGPHSSLTRDPSVEVDGVRGDVVRANVENDFGAAYYNALMWTITGDEAHALKAIEILNAYSATTKNVIGADIVLNNLYGSTFTNAAELIRHTFSGWSTGDIVQCETMLKSVFYPIAENFKPCFHGNWDHACMKVLTAISIFTDDYDMFNYVINYFYYGYGNGSIDNYVVYPSGQLQESNRDQSHCLLALGNLAEMSEMAYKQGVDLYRASDNAILRGYEYTAKYNLGEEVPYLPYFDYCLVNWTDYDPNKISNKLRSLFRPVFEIAYNHYKYRRGIEMPYTFQVLARGVEGSFQDYYDNVCYGSLLFYLNCANDYDFSHLIYDPDAGHINDIFTASTLGWAPNTNGSQISIENGKMKVTLVEQSNGTRRGDIIKTNGITLDRKNYPILAIKINKPQNCKLTLDTIWGAYGNSSGNQWTGIIGEDIYYYDFNARGFEWGVLPENVPAYIGTFGFKVADVTSGETSYTIDWIKTVKDVSELE